MVAGNRVVGRPRSGLRSPRFWGIAAPVFLVLLLVVPTAEGRTITPAFRGWVSTINYLTSGGCYTARSPAPQFNFTTGVGKVLDAATARSCAKTNGGGSFINLPITRVYLPLHLRSGVRSVSPTIAFTFNASESLTIGPKCPLVLNATGYGSSYCMGDARYGVTVGAFVLDATNSSAFPWTPATAVRSFANSSGQLNYGHCQKFVCTWQNASSGNLSTPSATSFAGRVSFFANGTANGADRYLLMLEVELSLAVVCSLYSHCVAKARADFASTGNFFQLISIKIV